jgi:FHA domain
MIAQEPNSSPSRVSDDALAKMISEGRTTISRIPESRAEVTNRLSRFNELYEALPTKPDCPSLMYKDPVTGSPTWTAIGRRLLVGRLPKAAANRSSSALRIHDDEMSRQHFEVVLTNDRLYVLNDLESLNGTYVDGVKQKTVVLIGGSEIKAGKTIFIFTGV